MENMAETFRNGAAGKKSPHLRESGLLWRRAAVWRRAGPLFLTQCAESRATAPAKSLIPSGRRNWFASEKVTRTVTKPTHLGDENTLAGRSRRTGTCSETSSGAALTARRNTANSVALSQLIKLGGVLCAYLHNPVFGVDQHRVKRYQITDK